MRRRSVLIGIMLASVVALAACGGSSTASPTAPTALPGTTWTLGLQGGTQPAAQNPPTITFGSDGKASGFGGCQPWTGTYKVDGVSIAVADLAKTPTQEQCAPSVITQQDAFLAALGGVTGWHIETVMPTAGVKVLEPVKLLLDGPTALVFTLE
jgi:heat shock protein HslJ